MHIGNDVGKSGIEFVNCMAFAPDSSGLLYSAYQLYTDKEGVTRIHNGSINALAATTCTLSNVSLQRYVDNTIAFDLFSTYLPMEYKRGKERKSKPGKFHKVQLPVVANALALMSKHPHLASLQGLWAQAIEAGLEQCGQLGADLSTPTACISRLKDNILTRGTSIAHPQTISDKRFTLASFDWAMKGDAHQSLVSVRLGGTPCAPYLSTLPGATDQQKKVLADARLHACSVNGVVRACASGRLPLRFSRSH
jgi:hypothetical protein